MSAFIDLTGQTFGKLIVVVRHSPPARQNVRWLCQCRCGQTTIVDSYRLRGKKTQSCGCLRGEKLRETNFLHGMSNTTEHNIWCGIIDRCYRKKSRAYQLYGKRGITVCQRWKNSFLAFLDDIGKRPSKKHSIDRIDNDKGYWCGKCEECHMLNRKMNCQWATNIEQCNNNRKNRIIHYDNLSMTISQWARHLGMPYSKLFYRINSRWPLHEAMNPERYTKKHKLHQ